MIPFNNLLPLHTLLASELEAAIQRVTHSGWYILGPEVEAFESEFAAYHGVRHAVGVANGTDAIELALRAAGIGSGDEVITVAHTAAATVCAIERAGATPVLVDIDEHSYTIDPAAIEAAVTPRTKAVVPVHLYGQSADLSVIVPIVQKHKLLLIEDCAQAHGARHLDQIVGTFGHLATFSFYPTKNLGALGDGGAVLTNDAQYAQNLRQLRNYGQTVRYHHDSRGVNSRLDELQAAVLRVKLQHLDSHNNIRRKIAIQYNQRLNGVLAPNEAPNAYHVYHLYVVRHPQRDVLIDALKQRGIGTLIHYPIPIHRQKGYHDLGQRTGVLPVTERVAGEIISLPMYIGLTDKDISTVIDAVNAEAAILGNRLPESESRT